jgi:hypothetical protein
MDKKTKVENSANNVNRNRREFLKSLAKRSAVLVGLTVGAHIPYKKPAVNSFFGVRKAYAYPTGPLTITVTVTDIYGTPSSGKNVKLYEANSSYPWLGALLGDKTTDASNQVQFPGLIAHDYYLKTDYSTRRITVDASHLTFQTNAY